MEDMFKLEASNYDLLTSLIFREKRNDVAKVLYGIPLSQAKELLFSIAESLDELAVIKAPAPVEFKSNGEVNITHRKDDFYNQPVGGDILYDLNPPQ